MMFNQAYTIQIRNSFYFVLLHYDEIYISTYLFHSLLQANQCAMVHVPFDDDDETFLNASSRFFLLSLSSRIIYRNI